MTGARFEAGYEKPPRRVNDLTDTARWIIDLSNLLLKVQKAIKDHSDLVLTPKELAILLKALQQLKDHANQQQKAAEHAAERARRAMLGRPK